MTDYTYYHGACVAEAKLRTEPGDVKVVVARDLCIVLPNGRKVEFAAGALIYSLPEIACVRTTVERILVGGRSHMNIVRGVIALMLGFQQRDDGIESFDHEAEAAVDAWLEQQTVVGIRYRADVLRDGRSSGFVSLVEKGLNDPAAS